VPPAVESREYKVLLQPALFGDDPTHAIAAFWEIEDHARYELDGDTEGNLDQLDVHRTVRFSTCRAAATSSPTPGSCGSAAKATNASSP
jgi:hypothetical protein